MKTYFVDSFTAQRFKGNPAAVCIQQTDLDEQAMQSIAAEIGFSETAFIRQQTEGVYSIRFFTPKMEIPLCGHATLASAKVIFDTTRLEKILFKNIDGVELPVCKAGHEIRMQFPVYDTEPAAVPQRMLDALGIKEVFTTRYSPKNKIILLEIADTQVLAALQPDFTAMLKSYTGINGVLVTARSADGVADFHYRYFWPWAGTDEDPVTGGVQTFLAKYWAERLGKNSLEAFQSSKRTGKMRVEYGGEKVFIYGEAVVILVGQLS